MNIRAVAFATILGFCLAGGLAAQAPDPTYTGTIVSVSGTSLVIRLADGSQKTLVVDSTTTMPASALEGSRVTVRYRTLDPNRFQAVTVAVLDGSQPPPRDGDAPALPATASNEPLLFLLGAWMHARAEAMLFQQREGNRLGDLLGRGPLDEAPSPEGPGSPPRRSPGSPLRRSAVPGEAWGRLEVPRLGISVLVAEGDDAATLGLAAGHISGTAFPGEGGNVGVAGHRDTVFAGLRDARPDDLVRLSTPAGIFDYRVESTRVVDPAQVEVLEPGETPVLSLVTCYPFRFIGRAPQRFVVRAALVSTTPAGPAVAP